MKKIIFSIFVATLTLQTLACGKILKNLRKDSDEFDTAAQGPTVGGVWPERSLIGSSELGDRIPAGYQSEVENMSENEIRAQGKSWVDQQAQDSNMRDRMRGAANAEDLQNGIGDPLAALNSSNAANVYTGQKRKYKNGPRASRADFIDDEGPAQAGSLWGSDGQTNYYFTKNKIRGVGDIITVKIETDLVKDTAAEVVRTLNERERENEIDFAQKRIDGKNAPSTTDKKDQVSTAAAAPARVGTAAPATKDAKSEVKADEDGEKREAGYADIDVSSAVDIKDGDLMMAEILERYPNGNYKIRGVKKVRYRNSTRLLNLVGVIRSVDIADDDTIPSSKMYEYRLEVLR